MKLTIEISWKTADNIIGAIMLISSFVIIGAEAWWFMPAYIFLYPVGLHMMLGNIKIINGKRMKRYLYWRKQGNLWEGTE